MTEAEGESGHGLISLNTILVKQARMDEVLHVVIEQSMSVFDSFVNRLGGDLVNLFCNGLEKA